MIVKEEFEVLRAANIKRSFEWSGEMKIKNTGYCSLELGGEVGELQDALKKYVRFLSGWPGGVEREKSIEDISDELGDVLICADRLAMIFDIDLYVERRAHSNKFKVPGEDLAEDIIDLGNKLGRYSGSIQSLSGPVVSYFNYIERAKVDLSAGEVANELSSLPIGSWSVFKSELGKLVFHLSIIAEFFDLDLFCVTKDKFNKKSEQLNFKTVIA